MTNYSGLYASLQAHIGELETKFIRPHLPLTVHAMPDLYDLDVRAFCILAYAAFEQFVEDVCVGLSQDAEQAWVHNRSCSRVLLGLIAFQRDRLSVDDDEAKPEVSFFAHIHEGCEEARKAFATFLRMKNNGVSVKYMRNMLLSVGIDVPNEPRWLGSLDKLARQRGESAHKLHVRKVPSPDDARKWVGDCMEMLAKVRDDAREALFQPQFIEDHRYYVI